MGPLPSPQPLASNVPPPPGLAPGTRLGRYEVVSELGTGGMATVYLGRALAAAGFQRLVAIKVLHPHLLRDEQFVQMFLDEGRLAARIHHPNVVATVDLEHTAQGLYIVSEYIEGDILLGLYKAARAQEKRIPFGVSLRVMLDALAGLHAAHELADDLGNPLKIIHRDVSPHNILVGSDGIARITDFGIAKAEERISTTRDGIVKGKLSYMAPEQPNDLPIDRRVDIFSAATVLWECLTGRRLFPGKTDGEVLQALLHKPITRLREVDPTLSPALDDVLARALSRDPDARFDTAADFADALEHAAAPQGIANARAVAQYVKDVAGAKITAEHERRRLTTRDLPLFRGTPSQVRPIERGSVPPPGPTSDAPPPPPPAPTSDAPPSPRSTPSHPSLPAVRLPPLPATHMAPPPPPPPADARISTPPLEPPPPPEPGEATELPSETIPSLVPPPPAAMSVPLARSTVSDEAPTQLQSLGHTPAGGTRAPPPSPLHTPAAGRPAMPPFPRTTPSAPLPPLPPLGVRTSVVASVPPPPPADPPATPSVVPSFVTPAHEGHEATVQGVAPPPAPAVSAPPPPPPSGATPSAPADVPPDTVRDLSLAATTAMAAIAPIPPPPAEATPPNPAAPLTPGATTVADDDDAAPTLLAIPAPPGMGRPSRKPADPTPALATPAVPAPAVPAPAVPAPPRPVVQARVGTGSHTPAEGRRRGPLVVGVIALGVLLGYGIWSFTGPASAPVEPHAASPAVVYPAARAAEPPASPPPMADPAPAQADPAPMQPAAATPPPAPVQPAPAPAQPVTAPAPVARPAVAAVAPAPPPVARPVVTATAPTPVAPVAPVARPAAAPAPAPEPSTGTAAPPPVLPTPSAEPPALPTTI